MDDEIQSPNFGAQRHDKWSFIVLAVDLAQHIAAEVSDSLLTATTLLMQHRQHRIEEDKFFEIVGD